MNRLNNAARVGLLGCVTACTIAALATPASATVYTVVNAGFESPDASAGDVAGSTGWATVAGGAFTTAGTHRTGNQAGKAFGNPGLFQQTITSADPVGTTFTASVYAASLSGDPITGPMGGFINIDFLNANGQVLATVTGGEQGSSLTSADTKDVYKLLTVSAPSVAGTTAVRIDLVAGPYSGAPGNAGGAVFFDDASLTTPTVPEPAALATLAVGGLTLVRRRRA